MAPGISFVICTRNGAPRLGPTLAHLAAQRFRPEVAREVLLVDNASSDDTAAVARRSFPDDPRMPLRVVREPRPGTGFARATGLAEAAYDFVTFVDDDNWLAPDHGQIAFDLMTADREVALLPARSVAVLAAAEPPWFAPLQGSFAVGDQFAHEGDVTAEFSHWWTAGLTLRVAAWQDLLAHGFRPRIRGRDGTTLGAGEETEMCLAILLAGWRAHCDERLVFRHWMPAERLTFGYACRLTFEGQAPVPALDLYRRLHAERGPRSLELGARWDVTLGLELARLALRVPRFAARLVRAGERDAAVFGPLAWLGRMAALVRFRPHHAALLAELRSAPWVGGGPERVARRHTAVAAG